MSLNKQFSTIPPEAFPSYTSFAKLIYSDTVILADNLPFNKRLKLNRFDLTSGQQFTIPLNAGKNYKQAKLDRQSNWQRKLIHAIDEFYKTFPYHHHLHEDLYGIIQKDHSYYTDYVFDLFSQLISLFKLNTKLIRSSELSSSFDLELLAEKLKNHTYLVESEFETFLCKLSLGKVKYFDVKLVSAANSAEELSLNQASILNYFSWGPYLSRLIQIA